MNVAYKYYQNELLANTQSQVCVMLSYGINIKNEWSVRKKEQCMLCLRSECEIGTFKKSVILLLNIVDFTELKKKCVP